MAMGKPSAFKDFMGKLQANNYKCSSGANRMLGQHKKYMTAEEVTKCLQAIADKFGDQDPKPASTKKAQTGKVSKKKPVEVSIEPSVSTSTPKRRQSIVVDDLPANEAKYFSSLPYQIKLAEKAIHGAAVTLQMVHEGDKKSKNKAEYGFARKTCLTTMAAGNQFFGLLVNKAIKMRLESGSFDSVDSLSSDDKYGDDEKAEQYSRGVRVRGVVHFRISL